jgi:HPt (histidine-containing phosphotransfer) domain-containing protein
MPDLPDRKAREETLAAILAMILEEWRQKIAAGGSISWDQFASDIRRRIAGELALIYLSAAGQLSAEQQMGLDRGVVTGDATDWAGKMAAKLAEDVVTNSRQRVEALLAKLQAEEISQENFLTSLVVIFSVSRAVEISISEVTRSVSAGEYGAAGRYNLETGQTLKPFWFTEADGRVCPVCAPLHGEPEEMWSDVYPGGPPGHPHCRCWLEWRPA